MGQVFELPYATVQNYTNGIFVAETSNFAGRELRDYYLFKESDDILVVGGIVGGAGRIGSIHTACLADSKKTGLAIVDPQTQNVVSSQSIFMNLTRNEYPNMYYSTGFYGINPPPETYPYDVFASTDELLLALFTYLQNPPSLKIPITYILSNTTVNGPTEESAGNDVSVTITPDNGYVIRNPSQGDSISVYNKNGYIPFTYADGVLTFTVPNE